MFHHHHHPDTQRAKWWGRPVDVVTLSSWRMFVVYFMLHLGVAQYPAIPPTSPPATNRSATDKSQVLQWPPAVTNVDSDLWLVDFGGNCFHQELISCSHYSDLRHSHVTGPDWQEGYLSGLVLNTAHYCSNFKKKKKLAVGSERFNNRFWNVEHI